MTRLLLPLLLAVAVARPPAAVAAGQEDAAGAVEAGMVDGRDLADSQAEVPVDEEVRFAITGFVARGNTILRPEELEEVLADFTGEERTAQDVEAARQALEARYHQEGYPAVLVNIPPQEVAEGQVILEVVESVVGEVIVTGNRHVTSQQITRRLPSLAAGQVLYLPVVQEELLRLNRGRDLTVTPTLKPGARPGTVDVELAVEDRLPVHGSLEWNNRASPNTTASRLNAGISYDDLWRRGHSLALQAQVTPEDPDEAQLAALSYLLPAPWHPDQMLALFALWSDSATAFGDGFLAKGQGFLVGARWVLPLPGYRAYSHNITTGFDYKDFDESLELGDGLPAQETPVAYVPLYASYNASLPDASGSSSASAGLVAAFRGLGSSLDEFRDKRADSRGNFLVVTMGLERQQRLPAGFGLDLQVDGQMTDQPLVANEQYAAGGMTSVRGYRESEVAGDTAVHASAELTARDLGPLLGSKDDRLVPYAFWDWAELRIRDALPGQEDHFGLAGFGLGVRGRFFSGLEFQLDWATALMDAGEIDRGEKRLHFRVKYGF
ncbi:MAG: ShlB/FhaC/HecB family hemolysin secretion/activation protein [Thermodesulfobacteriota bacterium]